MCSWLPKYVIVPIRGEFRGWFALNLGTIATYGFARDKIPLQRVGNPNLDTHRHAGEFTRVEKGDESRASVFVDLKWGTQLLLTHPNVLP